jgi:hypothetical protein
MTFPARISLVTLGVADVARATSFYEALGWRRSTASVPGTVSFFATGGALLSLYGTADLTADAHVAPRTGAGFRGTSLAVNVASPAEVDAAMRIAADAGATITAPAAQAPWGGYIGYFADPDGHLWEVAWNPGFPLGPGDLPQLPE